MVSQNKIIRNTKLRNPRRIISNVTSIINVQLALDKVLNFNLLYFQKSCCEKLYLQQTIDAFVQPTRQTIPLYKLTRKELNLCQNLNFSNHYIFETRCCKPLIFQTQIFDLTEFMTLLQRKSVCVTKIQFLRRKVEKIREKSDTTYIRGMLKADKQSAKKNCFFKLQYSENQSQILTSNSQINI